MIPFDRRIWTKVSSARSLSHGLPPDVEKGIALKLCAGAEYDRELGSPRILAARFSACVRVLLL